MNILIIIFLPSAYVLIGIPYSSIFRVSSRISTGFW